MLVRLPVRYRILLALALNQQPVPVAPIRACAPDDSSPLRAVGRTVATRYRVHALRPDHALSSWLHGLAGSLFAPLPRRALPVRFAARYPQSRPL